MALNDASRDSETLDRTLSALADPYRRRVIDLLRARPHRAGELADALGLAPPAMSRHLRQLRTSGLIDEDRDAADARMRVYRLRPGATASLSAWLEQIEALWTTQLAAFKAHVEKTP